MKRTKGASLVAMLCLGAVVIPPVVLAESTDPTGGYFLVADSRNDRVHALEDLDGDGQIDVSNPGEIRLFFDGSVVGVTLSVPSHIAVADDGGIFLIDGGTLDAVLRLEDVNADGDANDPGEAQVVYDSSGAGPRPGTPNTLLAMPDGSLLYSDDGSGKSHVVRLADLDGDGDMLDEGEWQVIFDGTNASGVEIQAPRALARAADGRIFVADGDTGAVLELTDVDGDGSYQGPGEAAVWHHFAPNPDLPDVLGLTIDIAGRVLAIDEDTGTVVALEDLNGDGDADDADEEVIVLGDGVQARPKSPRDIVTLLDGSIQIIDADDDTIYRLDELDGDGAFFSEGEVVAIAITGDTFSTPCCIAWVSQAMTDPGGGDGEAFVRGDANRDDAVDISDALSILQFLFLGGATLTCEDAADSDDSGSLNLSDAVYLLNHLFTGGESPPPPFPEPGKDETQDELDCGLAV